MLVPWPMSLISHVASVPQTRESSSAQPTSVTFAESHAVHSAASKLMLRSSIVPGIEVATGRVGDVDASALSTRGVLSPTPHVCCTLTSAALTFARGVAASTRPKIPTAADAIVSSTRTSYRLSTVELLAGSTLRIACAPTAAPATAPDTDVALTPTIVERNTEMAVAPSAASIAHAPTAPPNVASMPVAPPPVNDDVCTSSVPPLRPMPPPKACAEPVRRLFTISASARQSTNDESYTSVRLPTVDKTLAPAGGVGKSADACVFDHTPIAPPHARE
mmetsp:Transcript_41319/g.109090  ORF Transcript_41319/g.109090 Transcript_41319/m.109090 type:complete len:277 (+) Transcript_41319:578-1408(+)